MTSLGALLGSEGVSVIYDGACPFCSAYVKMLRLRKAVGKVTLVNARQNATLLKELAARDLQIDQEMVYSGGDAINVLALLTSPSGMFNRLIAGIMKKPERARQLYPYLRGGRSVALKLLGRSPIV